VFNKKELRVHRKPTKGTHMQHKVEGREKKTPIQPEHSRK
jgi:hypothetical protein